MPGKPVEQRVHGRMVPDAIAVLLGGGMIASVKLFGNTSDANHSYVGRQVSIHGQSEFFRPHADLAFGQFHMGDHTHRMDACIGSAGSAEATGQGAETLQNLFKDALNATPCSLSLPALVGRSMVGDHPFEFDYFTVQHRAIYTFICPCKR